MVKAIETVYAGCRFRSRIEARWAVVFDHLRINWQFEAQGFALPSGDRYLPDFMIMGVGDRQFYAEIKGQQMPDTREFSVASEINIYLAPLIILAGDIPRRRGDGTGWIFEASQRSEDEYAGDWSMVTPEKALIFGACGEIADVCIPGYEEAVTAGRSARFEHGESG